MFPVPKIPTCLFRNIAFLTFSFLFKPNLHRKGAKSAEESILSLAVQKDGKRKGAESEPLRSPCLPAGRSGSAVSVILERFYGHYQKFSPIYRDYVNAQEIWDE
jgi:hypothetical protein